MQRRWQGGWQGGWKLLILHIYNIYIYISGSRQCDKEGAGSVAGRVLGSAQGEWRQRYERGCRADASEGTREGGSEGTREGRVAGSALFMPHDLCEVPAHT